MASRIILSGLRSIEECIRANPDRIAKLLIPGGRLNPRIEKIRDLAKSNGIAIELNPKSEQSRGDNSEGVLALMKDYHYVDFEGLVQQLQKQVGAGKKPVVLVLDGITDPQNLGAIIRTGAFMGISGLIVPKDRAAAITDTVYRVASGGLEYVSVAQVTNIVAAMKSLKEIGFWNVGFSEHADQTLQQIRRDFPAVVVIGNEEKGIRPLVQSECDFLVRFDAPGALKSLNASVAAALALSWMCGMHDSDLSGPR